MVSLGHIEVPFDALSAYCQRNGIRRLSLFGSVLRNDFRPESDIDVLVEFEPDVRVGLRFFDMEQELSDLFGRKVDLNTVGFLSKYFRDEVLSEAVVQYDATRRSDAPAPHARSRTRGGGMSLIAEWKFCANC